jgi:hypothetical protein
MPGGTTGSQYSIGCPSLDGQLVCCVCEEDKRGKVAFVNSYHDIEWGSGTLLKVGFSGRKAQKRPRWEGAGGG